MRRYLMLAAALMLGSVVNAAAQEKVEVLHWWTSGRRRSMC